MFRPSNVFIFSLLFFLLIGSSHVFAQSNGTIEGTVTDEKNEPIIGAKIEVFTGGIKRGITVSDLDGNYIIKPLATGIYEVVGSYIGYKNVRITEIALSHDGVSKVNINFNPNALGEIIIVYKKPLITCTAAMQGSRYEGKDLYKLANPCGGIPSLPSSIHQPLHNCGDPSRNGTITYIDGVMIRQSMPVAEKEKKGFFSFLKRKKKSHE